jgi:hypothetical protein
LLLLTTFACGPSSSASSISGTYTLARFGEEGDCYPGGRSIPSGGAPPNALTVTVPSKGDTLEIGPSAGVVTCSVAARTISDLQMTVDDFGPCVGLFNLPMAPGMSHGLFDLSTTEATDTKRAELSVSWAPTPKGGCSMTDSWSEGN